MKTSVTLTFDNHVLENIKKEITDKSLSTFTNNLYISWLETKKKEQLIEVCKKVSRSKLYKEIEKSMEGATEDWICEVEKYERKKTSFLEEVKSGR